MDYQSMQQAHENAKLEFYQNKGYNFDRLPRKLITINITSDDLNNTSNIYPLIEPLTIDKLSDVYIDSLISNNLATTGAAGTAASDIFLLGIKEFNIQSVSNNQIYNNKLIIPNTTNAATSPATTIAHRATKFNYIGTVNPTKLSSLEISFTNSAGIALSGSSGTIWATFMFVARD